MEQRIMEYLVNSIWQVPLLAAGGWLVTKLGRPGPRVQHWIWLAVLALAVLMPMHRMPAAEDANALPVPVFVGDSAAEALQVGANASDADVPQAHGWLRMREIRLSPAATRWVVEFYLASMLFALGWFLWSWRLARRIVAEARPAVLTQLECDLLEDCCEELGLKRPEVLMSSRMRGPAAVGVLRPVVLLPESFAERSECELEAVLWHELAHVSRRDYLAILLCRLATLPIAYHPAAYAIWRRVRQTREMACDALAAAKLGSPVEYARSLVGLAKRMQAGQMQGAGLFDGGVLEERVMRLIETKAEMSVRMRLIRLTSGVAVVLMIVTAVAMLHVAPALAAPTVSLSPAGIKVALYPELKAGDASPSSEKGSGAINHGVVRAALQRSGEQGPERTLNSGDKLLIRVIQLESFPDGPIEIDANGLIDLPLLGKVPARGKTVEQLKGDLVARLRNYIQIPHVAVNLADPQGQPISAGGRMAGLVAGSLISKVSPVYPAEARAARVSGTVVLQGVITKQGTIEALRVVSGPRMLQQSALQAVKQWSWGPYLSDDLPTDWETRIGISFIIPGSRSSAGPSADVDESLTVVAPAPATSSSSSSMGSVRTVAYAVPSVLAEPAAPAPPPAPEGPARVSSGVMAGNLLTHVAPIYPAEAKTQSVSGVVVLHALISKTGTVEDLKVVSGPEMLTASAIDAVKQWTYKPYLLNGEPTAVETTITVNYNLGGATQPGQGPVRVSSGVIAGNILTKVNPVYPADAKADHISGSVVLHAIISKTGSIESLNVISGPKALMTSALDAVKQWTYKPYLLNGNSTEVETTITVNYSLGEPAPQQ